MVWVLLALISSFLFSETARVMMLSIGIVVFNLLPLVISFGGLLLFLKMIH